MTEYEEIKGYEEGIKVLQEAIAKVKARSNRTVKRGDYIICTNSSDWAYNRGERMWVDSVHDSHVLARPADIKYRNNGIFWVTNSDWVKE